MEIAVQPGLRLGTAADAVALFTPRFSDCSREKFAIAYLGANGALLHLSERGDGADHIDLPLRTIIADALGLDARSMILAHCHPSGDPNPSKEDIGATWRLARVAQELGIMLGDHLIFAERGHRSFRALGLL